MTDFWWTTKYNKYVFAFYLDGFQKRVVCTQFDIYVFIGNNKIIILICLGLNTGTINYRYLDNNNNNNKNTTTGK